MNLVDSMKPNIFPKYKYNDVFLHSVYEYMFQLNAMYMLCSLYFTLLSCYANWNATLQES